MNFRGHFQMYCWGVLGFMGYYYYQGIFKLPMIFTLFACFFIVNPDIDLLFNKLINRTILKAMKIKPIVFHRWALTHSIILPLLFYWALHPYLNMETAKEFGIFLFFPVLIHLFADFKIDDIIGNKTSGFWLICVYPLSRKRLPKNYSLLWVGINCLLIMGYMHWIF